MKYSFTVVRKIEPTPFKGRYFYFTDPSYRLCFTGRIGRERIDAEFRQLNAEAIRVKDLRDIQKWYRGRCRINFERRAVKAGWTHEEAAEVYLRECNNLERRVLLETLGAERLRRREARLEAKLQQEAEQEADRSRVRRQGRARRRFPLPRDSVTVVPPFEVNDLTRIPSPTDIALLVRTMDGFWIKREK